MNKKTQTELNEKINFIINELVKVVVINKLDPVEISYVGFYLAASAIAPSIANSETEEDKHSEIINAHNFFSEVLCNVVVKYEEFSASPELQKNAKEKLDSVITTPFTDKRIILP